MKDKAVIIDLDGTLIDNSARALAHLERSKANINNPGIRWDEFFAGSELIDRPNNWCAELTYSLFFDGYKIIFLTGRQDTEITGAATRMWLDRWFPDLVFDLYMRKAKDFRKNEEIKYDLLVNEIIPKYNVLFAIDDMKANIDMLRKLGIPALHCADF